MDIILGVVKANLNEIISLGNTLLGGLFILACFMTFLGTFQNKANWPGLFLRVVAGFWLLENYVWVMDLTRDIVVGVDKVITPDPNAANLYVEMSDRLQAVYEKSQKTGFSFALLGKKTLYNMTINLSFIFYAIVSNVMEAVRYTIIAIVYKLGPVLIPLIAFKTTIRVVIGWFTSYVAVLSWPILWHIVLSIATSLIGGEELTLADLEGFIMINFAVGFVLIYTPLIVAGLSAGIGVGIAASLAGRGAINKLTDIGHKGLQIVRGGDRGYSKNTNYPSVKGGLKNPVQGMGTQLSGTESKVVKSIRKLERNRKEKNHE